MMMDVVDEVATSQPDGGAGHHAPDGEIWPAIRAEAEQAVASEPSLRDRVRDIVLSRTSFCGALEALLVDKIGPAAGPDGIGQSVIAQVLIDAPDIARAAEADLAAVFERDPACRLHLQAFLYYKGFHALQGYRIAHQLWLQERVMLAYQVQSIVSERFGVDIHPAARMGRGVMIDHATSVTIGETAVVGDGCSLLHEVTLGGTGVRDEDRHPKIGRGVLIGSGAKVLGNITVGDEATIAAGSVVLKPVPAKCVVAGVPAKSVGGPCAEPARRMDQTLKDA